MSQGAREIKLVMSGRVFQLMGDTDQDALVWQRLIRGCVPSCVEEQRAGVVRAALRAALGGEMAAPSVEAVLDQPGPNGLEWMPLHYGGREYAVLTPSATLSEPPPSRVLSLA